MGTRVRGRVWSVVIIPVMLVAALVAENIPLLRAPDFFFAANPEAKAWLLGLCVSMAVLGVLLLVGAQLVVRRPTAEELSEEALGEGVVAAWSPMSHGEVEGLIARNRIRPQVPALWKAYRYRHSGFSVGRAFSISTPIRAMKQAWLTGQWRHNPVWQVSFIMMAGAMLILVGLFGLPVVTGPPLVRVIGVAAVLFALSRTAWAFYKA